MYAVSEKYLTAIRARTRTHRLSGTITLKDGTDVPLTMENIEADSVEIERSCTTGEELTFGEVILSELRMAVRTDLSRYLFFDAKISLNYEILLDDGTWESVPLGRYTVGEADRTKKAVSVIAYDNLIALDDEYDGVALYGNAYEILETICGLLGITLASTEDELKALPNGDLAIQIDGNSGCETYRDCVKVVCQLTGTFAIADRAGSLRLIQYGKESVSTLEKSDRFDLTASDFEVVYSGIVVKSSKGTFTAYDESVTGGLEMTINSAPAWDYGTKDSLVERTENLLSELKKIRYVPCELSAVSDSRYDCGDMVSLPLDDGTNVDTIVTKITWRLGRMEITGTGKNPYLYGIAPKKTQIIRELQQQTTANKLIFYSFSNGSDVVAEGTEVKPLASVTFVTVEDTSAMFLAQLPVVASAEDVVTTRETEKAVTAYDASGNPYSLTLTLTDTDTKPGVVDLEIFYYMNGSQVDYQLVESLTAGSHILSLFYPFSELKGNTSQKFEVRILATGGSVTVAKRAFRATVTGQGLSATTVWDGTLTIEEVVPAFGIRSRMALAAFAESVTTSTQKPIPTGITEVVSGFSIRSRMTLAGFTEQIGVNPVWEKQSITAARLSDWTYADRYVEHGENGVQLKTSWTYQSAEQTIDEGRMTVVKAVTADLASVEEVTVSG